MSSRSKRPHPSTAAPHPQRSLHRLYCCRQTYKCALGRANLDGSSKPCISCTYKIGNYDIARDVEFTKAVPNVRPELCPRSNGRGGRGGGALANGDGNGATGENDGLGEEDVMGYHKGMSVLTVGDGDFTFSLAIARLVGKEGRVVATSYEDKSTLQTVYPDFNATLAELEAYDVEVCYKVDATDLNGTLPKLLQPASTHSGDVDSSNGSHSGKYQRIVWNFPCTAIPSGQDGQNSAMEENKELVRKFVKNALPYLTGTGEIHMAHKTKPPYNQWRLEEVALQGLVEESEVAGGEADGNANNSKSKLSKNSKASDEEVDFEYNGRVVFDKSLLVPYTPRKALDRKSFPCHDACVYVFGWKTGGIRSISDEEKGHAGMEGEKLYSTIPLKQHDNESEKEYPVMHVTEEMIDELRALHLQAAEMKKISQREFGRAGQNKRRRKK